MGQVKGILLRVLAAMVVVFAANVAVAGNCGDDVSGRRVPCACGDAVVSSTRLVRTDPVVSQRCRGDGLIVRASGNVESLILDLAGLPLTGQGSGVGIRVLDGGAVGAILIGGKDDRPGQVAGFRIGISARGSRAIRAAENLVVVGNESDGVQVSGRGVALSTIVSDDNGRNGIRAHGRDHSLEGVSAAGNRRYDLRVSGNGHYVHADEETVERGAARVTGGDNMVAPAEVSR